jgi:uncharacterized BrkB/YihY/UPF0761 family membrane protein
LARLDAYITLDEETQGKADMPNQNVSKAFLLSFFITLAIAVAAILIALAASVSGTSTSGIGAYSGGVSQRFINVLALALAAIFVVMFFIFRRRHR